MTALWDLPDQAWSGWRLYQGELWSPEQERWTPAHIRALPYLLEALAERRISATRSPRKKKSGGAHGQHFDRRHHPTNHRTPAAYSHLTRIPLPPRAPPRKSPCGAKTYRAFPLREPLPPVAFTVYNPPRRVKRNPHPFDGSRRTPSQPTRPRHATRQTDRAPPLTRRGPGIVTKGRTGRRGRPGNRRAKCRT
jgi:hypothetical protein